MQTERITIPVYNLGCGGGGSLTIERSLMRAPGVAHAYVNPATEMAYVNYDAASVGADQLRAIIDDAGYGAPPTLAATSKQQAPRAAAGLDARRLALAAGLWLAAIYIVCLAVDLLFPQSAQMYRLWEQVLIGVVRERPETLLLGLVEAFFYGALGAWSLAALYQTLPLMRRT